MDWMEEDISVTDEDTLMVSPASISAFFLISRVSDAIVGLSSLIRMVMALIAAMNCSRRAIR